MVLLPVFLNELHLVEVAAKLLTAFLNCVKSTIDVSKIDHTRFSTVLPDKVLCDVWQTRPCNLCWGWLSLLGQVRVGGYKPQRIFQGGMFKKWHGPHLYCDTLRDKCYVKVLWLQLNVYQALIFHARYEASWGKAERASH